MRRIGWCGIVIVLRFFILSFILRSFMIKQFDGSKIQANKLIPITIYPSVLARIVRMPKQELKEGVLFIVYRCICVIYENKWYTD